MKKKQNPKDFETTILYMLKIYVVPNDRDFDMLYMSLLMIKEGNINLLYYQRFPVEKVSVPHTFILINSCLGLTSI